jgi:HlyD family secretion protein
MKKKTLAGVLIVMVVAAAIGYRYVRSKSQEDSHVIRVSGNIEVTEVEVSPRIPGLLKERLVSEGETVAAGKLVALLDDTELAQEAALRRAELQEAEAVVRELEAGARAQEIAEAQAAVQHAQAGLNELLAGSRPEEVAAAQATVKRAEAEATQAKADYDRQQHLLDQRAISAREYDVARTAYETATAKLTEAQAQLKLLQEGPRKEQIEQARATLEQAQARLALAREGTRKEKIEQARARLEQAKQSLALAETQLSYARVYSPLSGLVLSKSAEPGEYVAAGMPIVTVGDIENVWLRAYINETDLGRTKVGQRARITTDTYPRKVYDGRISFIASEAEFTPRNVQTKKERIKLVYRVKVDVRNPNMELKPGMPADAEIVVNPGR